MTNTTNIAIAEDHEIFRTTIEKIIEEQTTNSVVISVSNGQELLKRLEHTRVDLVILDLNMPIVDGKKALNIIRKKYGFNIRIIILSMHDNPLFLKKYMIAGANAYLNKGCSEEELMEAIAKLQTDDYYFSPNVPEPLRQTVLCNGKYDHTILVGERLTDREVEICTLICKGFTCPQIAQSLNRSIRTVENHKSNIFKKLSCNSSTEMMEKAIICGYYSVNI